ncbi:unnamed protein product [Adineta steineri]|uniref:Protein kinase domain-containing protein n=1 Tax=Adineta steineri TaxID=433720 RepID=A0A819B306_9BILA|nr:unnamed protein product [Adineta steineri]CAF3789875.1 unnamed protein product [Adineta steineri]
MFGYTNYYPNYYYYPDGDAFTGRTIRVNGQPYLFEKRLGAGGFGAVYSARTANNMPVAVKVIMLAGTTRSQKEGRVQSFLNEVAQLNRLRQESRHVVVIHNFGFDPRAGQAYIVMELGHENLYTLVKKLREMNRTGSPAIDGEMIKEFWRQMVTIVITLHKNGIVHMDLKPDNLILFGATLKIADLGISKKADALGLAGLGTMGYSAPEIMEDIPGVERYYGPKADIWSLGAILYFMVYGEPPTYITGPNPPHRRRPYPDHQLNDMLRRTLVRHPDARADIREVAQHPFTQH